MNLVMSCAILLWALTILPFKLLSLCRLTGRVATGYMGQSESAAEWEHIATPRRDHRALRFHQTQLKSLPVNGLEILAKLVHCNFLTVSNLCEARQARCGIIASMRLLNTTTLRLKEFFEATMPEFYCILSHTRPAEAKCRFSL
jgi:hypothetical protein